MEDKKKISIYNAIQNLYNMDNVTWQEVLAVMYNTVADIDGKFDILEGKFGILLPKEVREEIKKLTQDGTLADIINGEVFEGLNLKIKDTDKKIDDEVEKVNIKLAEISINIKSLGAKGDGITDDTPFIIQGLNMLKANGGGTLYFPNGTYIFSGIRLGNFNGIENIGEVPTINLLNNVTIKGESSANSIIKLKANSNTDIFVFRFVNKIRILNLTLDGNKNVQGNNNNAFWSGIATCNLLVRDSTDIIINDCKIINSEHFGINISSDSKIVKIKDNYISDCQTGIDIACQECDIIGNVVRNCSVIGIFLEGNDFDIDLETFKRTNYIVSVINNRISLCSTGISLKNVCSLININDNTVYSCTKDGIKLDASSTSNKNISYVNINDNDIFNINGVGILANTVIDSVMKGNKIRNITYGIQLLHCDHLNIKDNFIAICSLSGIHLSDNHMSFICNNRIVNCNGGNSTSIPSSCGVYVGSKNDELFIQGNYILDNRASKLQQYGVCMENNPTSIFIEDNIFRGNVLKDVLDKSGNSIYSCIRNLGETLAVNKITRDIPIKKGGVSGRPILGQYDVGTRYLDTSSVSNGKLIIWNGAKWVDTNGEDV